MPIARDELFRRMAAAAPAPLPPFAALVVQAEARRLVLEVLGEAPGDVFPLDELLKIAGALPLQLGGRDAASYVMVAMERVLKDLADEGAIECHRLAGKLYYAGPR